MPKAKNQRSIMLPFFIGILLGISAKFTDSAIVLYRFPIFSDVTGRFGIWVFAAVFLAVFAKTPLLAAARSFAFFAGMLSAYYGYTVLFLNFFPESQIHLWSAAALITPVCGYTVWHMTEDGILSYFLSPLPFLLFFTEWYLTGKELPGLFAVYLCMTLSIAAILPTIQKRIFGLLCALFISSILIWAIHNEIIGNVYEHLLNI